MPAAESRAVVLKALDDIDAASIKIEEAVKVVGDRPVGAQAVMFVGTSILTGLITLTQAVVYVGDVIAEHKTGL